MAREENKNIPPKPHALEVTPENIPPEMKARPYWVVWKYGDWDGKKYPKNLYNPNALRKMAKSTDPRTCGPFSKVLDIYQSGKFDFDGIGFIFFGDFSGVDIDHVINKETGAIDEGAAGTIARLNTYTEYSPSGTGTHSYFLGGFDGPACGNVSYSPYEIYHKGRFFTVTGHVYGNPLPIRKGGEDLQTFVNEERERRTTWKKGRNDTHIKENGLFPAGNPAASTDTTPAAPSSSVGMEGKAPDTGTGEGYDPRTAADVIKAIREHLTPEKLFQFTDLFDDGNISKYGGDKSAADIALMNLLPFWCKGSPDLMKAVFMESALAKRRAIEEPKKYRRPDYWKRTIAAALRTWNGISYDPAAWKKARQAETGAGKSADLWTLDTIPPDAADRMKNRWTDTEKKKAGKRWVNVPAFSAQTMADLLKQLQIKTRFNLLSWTAEYSGPGATYHNAAGKITTLGKEIDENAVITVLKRAAVRMGWNVENKKNDFIDALTNVVMSDSYNPAREYLEGAGQWYEKKGGGRDYIGELFGMIDIMDEYAGYTEFYGLLFHKWFVGAAVAAFNTIECHTSLQGVLVFASPVQGIGKSSFLPLIVPYAARRGLWVKSEGELDPTDKDSTIQALSYWIYERAEIDDLIQDAKKKNANKSFFTRDIDDYRRPYGRKYMKRPRITAFYGTANVSEMIADPTGGRRWWIMPIKSLARLPRLDFTKTNEEWENFLQGVWGQAATLMKSGYRISLDKEEAEKLAAINSNFEYVSNLERLFLDRLATSTSSEKYALTSTQVCRALDIKNPESSAGRMGRILNKYADRGIIERVKSHKAGKLYRVPFDLFTINDDYREPLPEKPPE